MDYIFSLKKSIIRVCTGMAIFLGRSSMAAAELPNISWNQSILTEYITYCKRPDAQEKYCKAVDTGLLQFAQDMVQRQQQEVQKIQTYCNGLDDKASDPICDPKNPFGDGKRLLKKLMHQYQEIQGQQSDAQKVLSTAQPIARPIRPQVRFGNVILPKKPVTDAVVEEAA